MALNAKLNPKGYGALRKLGALGLVLISLGFFFYPAGVTLWTAFSHDTSTSARPPGLSRAFTQTCGRYVSWAKTYLASQRAEKVNQHDVAATEWPLFGSVFLLLSAEELVKDGDVRLEGDVKEAVALAAEVVAHPAIGAWVRAKWGQGYLERENVFYRMLLVLGLGSYERTTGDGRHHALFETQARTLGPELLDQPHHLADDYPGECYPSDVLWAAAALKRAATDGAWDLKEASRLTAGLFTTLNGPATTTTGLPAFSAIAETAEPTQHARGSGNSGILLMAAELDPAAASTWFEHYAEHYWDGSGFLWGFREMPKESADFADVDSGPVLFGIGSVATGFGIGAARAVGRYDIAVPLVKETVPASWPTPFGLLLPGALGFAAADGWCFGELALHFSMTRPNQMHSVTKGNGKTPGMVWGFLAFYLTGGAGLLWAAWRYATLSE